MSEPVSDTDYAPASEESQLDSDIDTQTDTASQCQLVRVNLAERSYDVYVGHGLLPHVGTYAAELLGRKKCVIVTDSNVEPLYGQVVLDSLIQSGIDASIIAVPAGEPSKSMAVVEEVCREMLKAGLDRKSFLVALGGGVIGDLAGFAASIFLRGIPFIQVPTTVLSQVDSSVGGKTGVNTPEGKNLLGTFYQPSLVLADVDTLSSLPSREYCEGFAEIIKHAAIRDGFMFDAITAVADQKGSLADLIHRNVAIKARIVEADEHELTGERALLNFGHTIGHAIEASAGYGQLLHGEAIGLGMIAAASLSAQLAGLPPVGRAKIVNLVKLFNLPTRLPEGMTTETILEYMKHDKKFSEGKIRFVLLRSLGDAYLSKDVTEAHIINAIKGLRF
ncbi:MAG: 3-dehydroquinate synthase [Verrucomicrobium sp.]